jgi:hypothetical protein
MPGQSRDRGAPAGTALQTRHGHRSCRRDRWPDACGWADHDPDPGGRQPYRPPPRDCRSQTAARHERTAPACPWPTRRDLVRRFGRAYRYVRRRDDHRPAGHAGHRAAWHTAHVRQPWRSAGGDVLHGHAQPVHRVLQRSGHAGAGAWRPRPEGGRRGDGALRDGGRSPRLTAVKARSPTDVVHPARWRSGTLRDGRGPLGPTVVRYATRRKWCSPADGGERCVTGRRSWRAGGDGVLLDDSRPARRWSP